MIPYSVDQFLLHRAPPRVAMRYRCYKNWRWGDTELHALPILCDPRRVSIDVGAAAGEYTYHMARYSKRCIAVEPNPIAAMRFRRNMGSRHELLTFALSDTEGETILRVPRISGNPESDLGTIEPTNQFRDGEVSFDVAVRTLDSVAPRDVGFIKIDVEGHELSVLRGAHDVLKGDGPALLIELEERHRRGALPSVVKHLAEYGYVGHFLFKGHLQPISQFVQDRHQQPSSVPNRVYINNFLFTCDERTEKLREAFP